MNVHKVAIARRHQGSTSQRTQRAQRGVDVSTEHDPSHTDRLTVRCPLATATKGRALSEWAWTEAEMLQQLSIVSRKVV